MEQKYRLKHFLSYIPPTIADIIIKSPYIDEDFFPKQKSTVSLFPLCHSINNSIIMKISLNGFIELFSLMMKDDEKSQKEKLHSEYLSFSYSRMMFQISAIITQYGGEIIKCNNGYYTVIWEYSAKDEEEANVVLTAIQCAINIMKKINGQEISRGIKLQISIGIGIGECSFSVIGGINQRSDYVCYGKAVTEAEKGMYYNEVESSGGIVMSKVLYEKVPKEMKRVVIDEMFSQNDYVKVNYEESANIIYKTKLKKYHSKSVGKNIPDNINNKLLALKSFIPSAVIQYIDTNYDNSLKEIRIVTIMTIKIKLNDFSIQNSSNIQNVISTVQKCIYLTHGSLTYLTKEQNYLFIRCVWGVPPFSFYDDSARSVSAGLMLQYVITSLGYQIGIGISTGASFTGLCGVQGNRKVLEVMGGKVLVSLLLMEEAVSAVDKNDSKGEIYIDKVTMKMIQKWYRCMYIGISSNKCTFDIYTPMYKENDFIPNVSDPFPFIRTHKYNSYNPKMNNPSLNSPNEDVIKRKYSKINNNPNLNNTTNVLLTNNSISFSSMSTTPQEADLRTYRLKRSQTIFGRSEELSRMLNILNETMNNKQKQFIFIKGYLGSGKSLFIRKSMNNFIGSNADIANMYYSRYKFLFVANQNHITKLLPFNCIAIIVKSIYSMLIQLGKAKEIKEMITRSKISIKTLLDIQYILSLGAGESELNIFKDLKIKYSEEDKQSKQFNFPIDTFDSSFPFESDFQKIHLFFLYVISVYKLHLNEISKNQKIPLIFIIEDIQNADIYSLRFLSEIYKKDIKALNPIIIISTYQIPFHPLLSSSNLSAATLLSFDIFHNVDYTATSSNPKKVIGFSIDPLQNKHDMERMIIFCFKDLVMKTYKTNLERVDMKILETVLQKTFNGVPLLAIHLIDSLIHSEKYIQTLSGEFIITSEMIDNNDIFEWSDFIIPHLHDKICGEIIDSFFSMKEVIILKRASIIGTMFDVATLDEINPFKHIMNVNALSEILFMLEDENLLEIYNDYYGKNKKLVCKFSFPLLRECLYQRVPLELRSRIHLAIARLLESSKVKYFSIENENKMLRRHLQKSEMNINSEIERKKVKTIEDIVNSRDALNLNNMKIILVKNICSNFYARSQSLFMEGFLYKKSDGKLTWELRYFILTQEYMAYYYTKTDHKEGKNQLGKFSLDSIFKADVSVDKDNNTILSLSVSGWEKKGKDQEGRTYYLSGEKREDVYKWAISLNFLRVKAKYNSYIKNFDFVKFPLFKPEKISKEKYIMTISTDAHVYSLKRERNLHEYTYYLNANENMMNIAREYLFPLKTAVNSAFGVIIGMIQGKIQKSFISDDSPNESCDSEVVNDEDDNNDYLKYVITPKGFEEPLKKFFERASEEQQKYKQLEDEKKEQRRKKEEEEEKKKNEEKEQLHKNELKLDLNNFPSITDIEPISKDSGENLSEDSFNMSINEDIDEAKNIPQENNPKTSKHNININNLPSRKLLPNDFVPRKCQTSRSREVFFPPSTIKKESVDSTGECITVISECKLFKDKNLASLNQKIKGKKLFDDPKYAYVEKNESTKHQKIHKSNLFKLLKTPKKK